MSITPIYGMNSYSYATPPSNSSSNSNVNTPAVVPEPEFSVTIVSNFKTGETPYVTVRAEAVDYTVHQVAMGTLALELQKVGFDVVSNNPWNVQSPVNTVNQSIYISAKQTVKYTTLRTIYYITQSCLKKVFQKHAKVAPLTKNNIAKLIDDQISPPSNTRLLSVKETNDLKELLNELIKKDKDALTQQQRILEAISEKQHFNSKKTKAYNPFLLALGAMTISSMASAAMLLEHHSAPIKPLFTPSVPYTPATSVTPLSQPPAGTPPASSGLANIAKNAVYGAATIIGLPNVNTSSSSFPSGSVGSGTTSPTNHSSSPTNKAPVLAGPTVIAPPATPSVQQPAVTPVASLTVVSTAPTASSAIHGVPLPQSSIMPLPKPVHVSNNSVNSANGSTTSLQQSTLPLASANAITQPFMLKVKPSVIDNVQKLLLVMNKTEALEIKIVTYRYTSGKGCAAKIKHFLFRIWNAIKALFGKSEWQLARKIMVKHILHHKLTSPQNAGALANKFLMQVNNVNKNIA